MSSGSTLHRLKSRQLATAQLQGGVLGRRLKGAFTWRHLAWSLLFVALLSILANFFVFGPKDANEARQLVKAERAFRALDHAGSLDGKQGDANPSASRPSRFGEPLSRSGNRSRSQEEPSNILAGSSRSETKWPAQGAKNIRNRGRAHSRLTGPLPVPKGKPLKSNKRRKRGGVGPASPLSPPGLWTYDVAKDSRFTAENLYPNARAPQNLPRAHVQDLGVGDPVPDVLPDFTEVQPLGPYYYNLSNFCIESLENGGVMLFGYEEGELDLDLCTEVGCWMNYPFQPIPDPPPADEVWITSASAVIVGFSFVNLWHFIQHAIPLTQLLHEEAPSFRNASVHLYATGATEKFPRNYRVGTGALPLLTAVAPPHVSLQQVYFEDERAEQGHREADERRPAMICYAHGILGMPYMRIKNEHALAGVAEGNATQTNSSDTMNTATRAQGGGEGEHSPDDDAGSGAAAGLREGFPELADVRQAAPVEDPCQALVTEHEGSESRGRADGPLSDAEGGSGPEKGPAGAERSFGELPESQMSVPLNGSGAEAAAKPLATSYKPWRGCRMNRIQDPRFVAGRIRPRSIELFRLGVLKQAGAVAAPRSCRPGMRPLLLLILRKLRRRITNVMPVIRASEAAGFEVRTVVWEDLHLWRQVQLARQADVLVGAYGMGLTHILWMQPKSVLIELFPRGDPKLLRRHAGDYGTLASVVGLTHLVWSDPSKHYDRQLSWLWANVRVDIVEYRQLLLQARVALQAKKQCAAVDDEVRALEAGDELARHYKP